MRDFSARDLQLGDYHHTFTAVGRCPRTGRFGIAVATGEMGVGGRVPFISANIGAVATQAYTDPRLGPLAIRLLEEAAAAHPLTLADPAAIAVFSQFGGSSLDFELRAFATGVVNARVLRHELHLMIDDAFRAHGIEIAFPQQDIHVRSLPESYGERTGQSRDWQPPVDSEPGSQTGTRRVA